MIRATKVLAGPNGTGIAADVVVLDFDDRHRRRMVMTGVRGLVFLVDLPEAVMLRNGDALELEDGRHVEVVAAPEPLIEIKGRAPQDLVRLAWHIGNRHLPAQILPNAIRIRRDHVIEEMLRGLGARLVSIEAPFDPLGGAYAQHERENGSDPAPHGHADHHHGQSHDHGHHCGHDDHDHDHDHDHRHEPSHKHGH